MLTMFSKPCLQWFTVKFTLACHKGWSKLFYQSGGTPDDHVGGLVESRVEDHVEDRVKGHVEDHVVPS